MARMASDRRGVVLIVVLVVIALMALSAFTFCDMMLAERKAVEVHSDLSQSLALVESGVAAAQAYLLQDAETRTQFGGVYNNPTYFQAQVVAPDNTPHRIGYFSIMASVLNEEDVPVGVRYGLQNESGKININALVNIDEEAYAAAVAALLAASADEDGEPPDEEGQTATDPAREALMALPGMTLEIADAILDWVDADDEPREFGVERDYYSTLDPPYQPKNGPLHSIDELIMVRDVTPDLLYGRDRNRNGLVDPHESLLSLNVEADTSNGSLELGWSAYLTTVSREINLDPVGNARIDLNGDDLETLYDDLSAVLDADLATFIIAFRQNGPANDDEEDEEEEGEDEEDEKPEAIGGRTVDLTRSARASIDNILDLVDAKVRTELEDEEEPVLVASPLTSDPVSVSNDLSQLLDYATVDENPVMDGRININHAPRAVLLAIPGMRPDVATAVAGSRTTDEQQDNSPRRHPTWLLAEGFVDLEEMKQMMPYVTGGGDVYRAHVVGFYGDGRATSRVDVVIDGTKPNMSLLLWNDVTSLGRGFDMSQLSGGTLMEPSNVMPGQASNNQVR